MGAEWEKSVIVLTGAQMTPDGCEPVRYSFYMQKFLSGVHFHLATMGFENEIPKKLVSLNFVLFKYFL